jgi:hypothetical protein
MKRLFTSLFFLSISYFSYCQNNVAVVNKIQNFYVFTDCQPLGEYELIGEVNTSGSNDPEIKKSNGQYQPVRDFLIKTARQVNYTADGIILSLVNGGIDKAVIIKFKENSINNSHAKVNQYQGVYVFVDNEPFNETDYVGTIKDKGKASNSQYTTLRDRLISRCKNEFTNTRGMIIKFVNGGIDTGDLIKFKN